MNKKIDTISRFPFIKSEKGKTIFLFGPRKIGKSTYLKKNFADSLYFNLLDSALFFELQKEPFRLREKILSMKEKDLKLVEKAIIVDEIQKIPALLDEVHLMIEDYGLDFILCGSSARKLKRSSVNMLGGRAWSYGFYPFTYLELKKAGKWNLLQALKQGLIPNHYLEPEQNFKKNLQSYVQTYLKEEVQEESLVRNLASFSRFVDSLAYSHGELTNYSNIARDCAVDSKTVKEYYQILIDTLLGRYVYPYSHENGRETIKSTPKFYLFDVGLANYICHYRFDELRGEIAGKALEHFVFMELSACISYYDLDYEIKFWRTKTGLEVDFILTELREVKFAFEVKISKDISRKDLKSLIAFKEENPNSNTYLLCLEKNSRLINLEGEMKIQIINIEEFLEVIWSGNLI